MSIDLFKRVYVCIKPYLFMIFLQASYGLNGLVIKCALNKGLNHYTFSVYRNAFATLFIGPFAFFLERKLRPKMTISIFLKIMLLGLLGYVFGIVVSLKRMEEKRKHNERIT
ncbi:putative EamA domain-containing protein [Helianthus anomalus]